MDCFIIMPISTPDDLANRYSKDKDHFKHVLDHLFVPAIEKVGMTPVPPIAQGSDIIHAEIIRHIEGDGFVLCDMSALNPNVFFELGIRTAVNKPIALVKDDATPRVPFDTHIINNHTYLSALNPWTMDSEIEGLATHLQACVDRATSGNTLWNYFSLSSRVPLLTTEAGLEGKVDFLTMQIAALRKEIDQPARSVAEPKPEPEPRKKSPEDELWDELLPLAQQQGVTVTGGRWGGGEMMLKTAKPVPKQLANQFVELAKKRSIKLKCVTAYPEKNSQQQN
ncbi:MAG: hypothetical protein ABIG43_03705 [Chloroflexota bacterium]